MILPLILTGLFFVAIIVSLIIYVKTYNKRLKEKKDKEKKA